MGKCISKDPQIGLIRKRSLTKDSDHDEKSSEFRENMNVTIPVLKSSDKNIIKKSLKKHFLFRQLSSKELLAIYERMKFCELLSDEMIYDQGSQGSKFFIIKRGTVEVLKDSVRSEVLSRGDTFGEMALLTRSKRKETVQTLGKAKLWSLSRCNFRQALKQIFSKNFDNIRELISKVRFFTSVADSQKNALTKFSILHEYVGGDVILKENDEGELLFIVIEGRVKYSKEGMGLCLVEAGGIFGEVALLTGNSQRYTVVAAENCKLISIDRESLVSVFGENFREILFKNIAKNSITSDSHLEFLSKEHIIMLVESLEWNQYPAGHIVIPEGYDKKSRFFVVCSGEIISSQSKQMISSYQLIGLQNSNERNMLEEQYIAGQDTIIGEITAISIENLLNLKIDTLFQEVDSIKVLKNIGIFKYLSLPKLKSLSSKLFLEEFEKKEIIFSSKEAANTLYIIKEGQVDIFNEGKLLRTLGKYDIFGERCITESLRSASARAITRVECWVLEAESLKAVMEDSIALEIERRKYYQADILLNNLLYVQMLNDKSDRKMYITYYEKHNTHYNVQVINKEVFSSTEQCMLLVQEKQISLQLDHFLIIKLVKTFTDPSYVYFVTEHINAVTLREVLKVPLRENYARFSISCIVAVIEHLHDRNIIYRDLCPENILINSLGYAHLFNFSASKIVKGRTYTNIGNPFYRSPEIVLNRGYSKSTDYWSLGVVLYEMLYGCLPFDIQYNDDPVTVYQKIIDYKLVFTEAHRYSQANDLLQKLLINDTIRAQAEHIKKHDWMKKTDWEGLARPSMQSLCSPRIILPRVKTIKENKRITIERYINEIQNSPTKSKYRRSNTALLFRWDKFF